MASNNIVVVGAGVIGLTTAYLLSKDTSNCITVVAKHMPGDYDIEYCSPWAGANFMPFGKAGTLAAQYEKDTWPYLQEITEKYPEAGIHFRDTIVYARKKDASVTRITSDLTSGNPWFQDVVPNFKNIPSDQLDPEINNASQFTSVCINTVVYLSWLVGQCRKNGVVFERGNLKNIVSAADHHHTCQKADLVINCTGLASKTMGGVRDDKMYPVRGQIVVVRNDPGPMMTSSGTDDADDELFYVMTRAAGGGTVLGGSYQKDAWDPLPDPNLATRIMKRAIEAHPGLVRKGEGIEALDIVRHGVGLRPFREGGARIETEKIDGIPVVHNYGHGGSGYQSSFACANLAVKLAGEALKSKAKL